MKRLFYASATYTLLGLASGLYYREFTKANSFTAADGFTQLSVVHTHLLTLGTVLMLIFLVLEKVFILSGSKMFTPFFWVYNAGLVITAGTMVVGGTRSVLGEPVSAAIAGIAGMGHILLTIAFVFFFIALAQRALPKPQEAHALVDASAHEVRTRT